jgi:hypothetical protein
MVIPNRARVRSWDGWGNDMIMVPRDLLDDGKSLYMDSQLFASGSRRDYHVTLNSLK